MLRLETLMTILGWTFTILISFLMGAVLELNKNTLFGWLLFAIALAGMAVISVKYMGYRLSVFGFLASEEMLESEGTAGNFGLLDQIKALEWVRQNIESFGGDPNSETLSGFEQSTDSSKVMEFGTHTGMIEEPDLALYEILDRMYGWENE